MQLRNVIDSPCGLRHLLDGLEVQSGFTRRWLLEMPMMTQANEIEACHGMLKRFVHFINDTDKIHLDTLLFRLQGLKDIRTTIGNLGRHAVLDDIELFEVKHLSLLATEVNRLLAQHGMDDVVEIPSMDDIIHILDPDGLNMAAFYIYDSYCEPLKELRARMRQHPEQQDKLLLQAKELEDEVRQQLSQRLSPFAPLIERAQLALAQIDLNMAKALQMRQWGLTLPVISSDGTCRYHDLFHPQVKEALERRNRQFQPVDIAFGHEPTLITGANMGGKTVVLKALTLCQYLFQFGFGVPAGQAVIAIKDEIHFCIGDEQSIEKGLSSFAAEMKNIDAVITASRQGKKLLALIDEPARTTNPTEGAALVTALLRVLDGKGLSLVMTTHYDIDPEHTHRLRVTGFDNGRMNYQLVEVDDGEVPHEALAIARSLGIDNQWLDTAQRLLHGDKD